MENRKRKYAILHTPSCALSIFSISTSDPFSLRKYTKIPLLMQLAIAALIAEDKFIVRTPIHPILGIFPISGDGLVKMDSFEFQFG